VLTAGQRTDDRPAGPPKNIMPAPPIVGGRGGRK